MEEDCGTCGSVVDAPEVKENENPSFGMFIDVPSRPEEGSQFIPTSGGSFSITITGESKSIFTLEIEDKDGCSVLKSPLKDISIPANGKYTFTQKFSPYTSDKDEYTFKLEGDMNHSTIKQYPQPTITLKQSSSSSATTNPQTLTLSGDDITSTGNPFEPVDGVPVTTLKWDNRAKKYINEVTVSPGIEDVSWTVAKAGDYAGNLYISRLPNNNDISTNASYTNTVAKKVNSAVVELSSDTADIKELNYISNVKITSTITKTVKESIGITSCDTVTDKFKLNNITNLLVGMSIVGEGVSGSVITHIDYGDNIITVDAERVVKDGTELTFYYNAIVMESIKDHHSINLEYPQKIHKGATIVFENNISEINASLTTSGSGSGTITIGGTFFVISFGDKDVIYSVNVDNFITNTPNAYDQDVFVTKDTTVDINMVLHDADLNASDKTGTIISGPSHGSVSEISEDSIVTYTPYIGYTGKDKFTFTMSDGANASAEKTIYITVI